MFFSCEIEQQCFCWEEMKPIGGATLRHFVESFLSNVCGSGPEISHNLSSAKPMLKTLELSKSCRRLSKARFQAMGQLTPPPGLPLLRNLVNDVANRVDQHYLVLVKFMYH